MITQADFFAAAALQGRLDVLDAGAGVVRVRGYSLDRPAAVSIAPTGVLLFELPLLKPCGTITGVELALRFAAAPLALDTGVLSFCRVIAADDRAAFDMSVGLLSSTAEVRVTTLNVTAGQPVAIRIGKLR